MDTLRASATYGASELRSGVARVTWNSGVNQAPLVSAGPPSTITMPAAAVLAGTVNDDGLPAGSTLNIQWTQVSGQGTATFDNPRSPQTHVTFSQPGSYVLRLTASDGVLSSNAEVTVGVNAEPTTLGGWIATPVHVSTTTGTVDITTIAGLTLTSGTLSYYPGNFPNGAVTINSNVTGSGVIGTLDTSKLVNGSYWIRLHATNSVGQTQTSAVMVFVTGEYKPGRMKVTMTDLVVPAAGFPIRIEREYDSLERNTAGDFGFGWKLSYNAGFEVDELHNVTMTMGGSRKTFQLTPVPNPIFQGFHAIVYTAPAGMYGKLESLSDTCSGILTPVGGGRYRCAIATVDTVFRIDSWKYTDPAGRAYTWSRTAGLQTIEDLNGNKLTFGANGITSSAGNLNVPILRDMFGRITRITDPLGKHYQYGYGPSGDLETVTYPGIVTAAQFTYDAGHLLKDYRDPRGLVAQSTTYDAAGRLASVTDMDGTVSYAYNPALRQTTVTNPDTGVEVTETDARGNVVRKVDGEGHATTFTHDARDNVLTETNALGKTTAYTYNANGFRTSVKNPMTVNETSTTVYNEYGGPTEVKNALQQAQTITYDSRYQVNTISDSLGQIAQFSYNAQGLPLTMKDARGNTWSYTYDSKGNRTSQTDPEGRTKQWTYSARGEKLTETDARGNRTTYVYDDAGRMTSMTDTDNKVTTYVYDASGNKIEEIDPLLRSTKFEYDAKNRLTKTIHPDLTFRTKTYDFRGNVLTETDESGRVTKYVYDKAGRLTSVTKAFGTPVAATVSYVYDAAGRKTSETDERGNTTQYGYDDANRLKTVTNAQGKTTTYNYDLAGRRTSVVDANNRTRSTEYDARGRVVKETGADLRFATHTYDGAGMRLTTVDQENRTTTWGYDKVSQLVSVTNAMGHATSYGYDPNGNKTRQTDALGRNTTYTYDKMNRRTRRTLPLAQYEEYTYDAAGRVTARRDFNGKTTTFDYWPRNWLKSKTPDPSLTGGVPLIHTSFTYNPTGTRATMTDGSGTTSYTYDARDRLLTKATAQGTLTYTYHANHLVATVVSSNANGVNVSYGYDSLNRLTTVTDNRLSPGVTTHAYDDVSNLASATYPNGVVHTYDYDSNYRLTDMPVRLGAATLARYTHTFDFAGHKKTASESTGRVATYDYDPAYRLLSETVTGPGAGQVSYTLDNVGNRLARSSTLPGILAATYGYDANDRLSGDTYDGNGNTLLSGGVTYSYDYEDRMTAAGAVTMAYDGDGNRVSRTAAGVTTRFLVDDLTPTGYAQVAEEVAAGAVTVRYTHGLQRISQTRGAVTSFYGYDGGGSVRQLTNTAGAVTDTYTYDAYGVLIGSTGSTVNAYRYRGEQWDEAVGMYYLRARWYDARSGEVLDGG